MTSKNTSKALKSRRKIKNSAVINTFGESISPLSNKEGEQKTEDVWLFVAL